jgi:hypothetical protein
MTYAVEGHNMSDSLESYAKKLYLIHPNMAQAYLYLGAAVKVVTLGCIRETMLIEGFLAISTVLAPVCLIQTNGIH